MQTVKMIQDEDPMDPREWENLGKMVCWYDRYNLGDKHSYDCDNFLRELAEEIDANLFDYFSYLESEVMERYADFVGYPKAEDKVENKIQRIIEKVLQDNYVILPLYLYDHSGITMKTSPFLVYGIVDKLAIFSVRRV